MNRSCPKCQCALVRVLGANGGFAGTGPSGTWIVLEVRRCPACGHQWMERYVNEPPPRRDAPQVAGRAER